MDIEIVHRIGGLCASYHSKNNVYKNVCFCKLHKLDNYTGVDSKTLSINLLLNIR